MRILRNLGCLWLLLALNSYGQSARDNIQVEPNVERVEMVRCGTTIGLKMELKLRITNVSTQPTVIGKIGVEQERFYKLEKDKSLKLMWTTEGHHDMDLKPGPPVPLPNADSVPALSEEVLASRETKTFKVGDLIYLTASSLPRENNVPKLIISFHIFNFIRSGEAWDDWSDPVTILLPVDCRLGVVTTASVPQ